MRRRAAHHAHQGGNQWGDEQVEPSAAPMARLRHGIGHPTRLGVLFAYPQPCSVCCVGRGFALAGRRVGDGRSSDVEGGAAGREVRARRIARRWSKPKRQVRAIFRRARPHRCHRRLERPRGKAADAASRPRHAGGNDRPHSGEPSDQKPNDDGESAGLPIPCGEDRGDPPGQSASRDLQVFGERLNEHVEVGGLAGSEGEVIGKHSAVGHLNEAPARPKQHRRHGVERGRLGTAVHGTRRVTLSVDVRMGLGGGCRVHANGRMRSRSRGQGASRTHVEAHVEAAERGGSHGNLVALGRNGGACHTGLVTRTWSGCLGAGASGVRRRLDHRGFEVIGSCSGWAVDFVWLMLPEQSPSASIFSRFPGSRHVDRRLVAGAAAGRGPRRRRRKRFDRVLGSRRCPP